MKPPHRILTILEGESLLSDATALLIYRLAVGAVAAGGFSIGAVAPTFFLAVVGSVAVGPALGWLWLRLTDQVQDVPTAIILQFVSTFGVWILADRIGLSGVLTMVCYAITVARTSPERTPARIRIPSYAVWETVVFVLNVLAFVFIGLQIRPILQSLEPAVRQEFMAHLGTVDADPEDGEARRFAHNDIHRRALEAARHAVLAMRASDEIGDDAFHEMEEELDWIEMAGGGQEEG